MQPIFRFHQDIDIDIEMRQPGSSSTSNGHDNSSTVVLVDQDGIEETRIQMDAVGADVQSMDETRIQMRTAMTSQETPLPCKLKSSFMKAAKVLDSVRFKRKFFGPDERFIRRWNTVFLVACLGSLYIDPLFLFLPSMRKDLSCIQNDDQKLKAILTVITSVGNVFYMVQIYFRFHIAYIAPTSSTYMFGRGSLVWDPRGIAVRYLKKGFLIDFIAALPLSQVMIWGVISHTSKSMLLIKNVLKYISVVQYLSRLFLMLSLSSQTVKVVGAFTEAAWVGAAYNLMLSLLTSHVLGAWWFYQAIKRQEGCWQHACNLERQTCQYRLFDCTIVDYARTQSWYKASNVTSLCDPANNDYSFGIYGEAVTAKVTSSPFFNKYFYSLWWGLKNLSSLGQGLSTSTSIEEILFAIIIAILGLVLFALLIGNIQRYLQSTTFRLDEWRIRRAHTEQWMRLRLIPPILRESIRKYDQYSWDAKRGVDEETVLKGLPVGLQRDIKRHMCFHLLQRVPLLDFMDEPTLDAICERLKPTLYTEDTYLIREGDPIHMMHFIIRGRLESICLKGGQVRYIDICKMGPGDTCGEELLTWMLEAQSNGIFPLSLRTVKSISEVEAFTVGAEDLKFVTAQFRMLHSKEVIEKLKHYSHQWRSWAAYFIQMTWRRYKGIELSKFVKISKPTDGLSPSQSS